MRTCLHLHQLGKRTCFLDHVDFADAWEYAILTAGGRHQASHYTATKARCTSVLLFILSFLFYPDIFSYLCPQFALVAELVYALDLGSSDFGRAGSSPVRRTSLNAKQLNVSCLAF